MCLPRLGDGWPGAGRVWLGRGRTGQTRYHTLQQAFRTPLERWRKSLRPCRRKEFMPRALPCFLTCLPALVLAATIPVCAAVAQSTPATPPPSAQTPEKRITPDQAQELFKSVDALLHFASSTTGLEIKSPVKRALSSRAEVEAYLQDKLNDDKDAKRMEQSEVVLKKFGLLDRDFQLRPFLMELLKEQIAGYYDPKTKTVYILNWVDPETQKPVLVHELTHALQDQRVHLESWSDQTPEDVSHNASEDNEHLARDEMDTARDAVTEGQAMAVFVNYALRPSGQTLLTAPEIVQKMEDQMNSTADSPVLARAPLLLSQSLIFPYQEGLGFTQDLWMDKGRDAAFAGALDHPPSSSWEVMNPRYYEQHRQPPVLLMPNIHPLVDARYRPIDIGQIGQLDLRILATLYGGASAARKLTPAWDGGIYWAGQLRSATAQQQSQTGSVALLYLSAWTSAAAARVFASLEARELALKYDNARPIPQQDGDDRVYSTSEGMVLIRIQDRMVFVAESFELDTARKLAELLLGAQGAGEMRMAGEAAPRGAGSTDAIPARAVMAPTLSAPFAHFFASCGWMKAALPQVGAR